VQFGVGDFTTYNAHGNFESPVQTELRSWEQFQLNGNINKIKLEHRYRIEQRFFSYGYRNRFRYRINTVTPILKTKGKSNLLHVLFMMKFLSLTTIRYLRRIVGLQE
jgi:hypothetical protein